MNPENSIRPIMFLGFLLSSGMIAIALFFQYYMGMEPCPLCITQRVIVVGLGILFLLATLQGPKNWGRRIYGLLLGIASFMGILIAGRHTWLQHLPPDKIPECGPGLEYWINTLPALDVIEKVFQGTGECAEVLFTFIGLSIPEWSFIAFTLFFLFSLKLFFTAK